jgi:hypothetical protein
MSDLPFLPCVVSYNGVSFGNDTQTLDCSIRPVLDTARRTVIYNVYSLTIRGHVSVDAPDTTDDAMTFIRRRLTRMAGEFRYRAIGLGDLTINVPAESNMRDVIWGPKPTILKWRPHGQLTAEVTWTVEIAIPPCDDVATWRYGIMEMCWSVDWSIDKSGYTTRTFSGHLSVPQTRDSVDSRTLSDQADRWREWLTPAIPPGFRRTPGNFRLSEDKCRLNFSMIDEEIGPNYPPPGVIDVQASHSFSTGNQLGATWTGTLSATYEMERGTPRSDAFYHFMTLLRDRQAESARQFSRLPGGRREKVLPIPRAFSMSEPEIYGRRGAAFSCTYTFVCSLPDMLRASALWRPVPGSNWQQWAGSLAANALSSRGNAGMRFAADGDYIIDLCLPAAQTTLRADGPTPPPRPGGRTPPEIRAEVTAGASWLRYESWLRLEIEDNVIEHKPHPPREPPRGGREAEPPPSLIPPGGGIGGLSLAPSRGEPAAPLPDFLAAKGPAAARVAGKDPFPELEPLHQLQAKPSYFAILHGWAIRAGFAITPPALVSVGAAKARPFRRPELGDGFEHAIVDHWFGVPVYSARWQIRYVLAADPGGVIPFMDVPFLGD